MLSAATEVLCVEVKTKADILEEDDLVLDVRRRDVERGTYGEKKEVIVKKAAAVSIDDLKAAIIA